MSKRSKMLGDLGESVATEFLIEHGYKILSRNFRINRVAEIDIVAETDGTIVFVEVKTRSTNSHGTPAEAVTPTKQARIFTAAEIFLQQHEFDGRSCRFDVIEVFATREGFGFNHILDAFAL